MSLNVFWDNSNIWLVGKNYCSLKEPGHEREFRVHFKKLLMSVVDGRQMEFAFVGGSLPPNNDVLWSYFDNLGVKVEVQERGAIGGGEVAVDQAIQYSMLKRLIDADAPGTILLLTGDGNGHLDGEGFIPALKRAVKMGWNFEVASWDLGCNRHLRQYAEEHGVYRSLEPSYEHITFLAGGRNAL